MYNRRSGSGQRDGGWGGLIGLILVVVLGLWQPWDQPTEPVWETPEYGQVEQSQESSSQIGELIPSESDPTQSIKEPESSEHLSNESHTEPYPNEEYSTEPEGDTEPSDAGMDNQGSPAANRLQYQGHPVIIETGTTLTFNAMEQIEFSELDALGRPGPAQATLSMQTTRPSQGRGSINVDPVGFNNKQYTRENGKSYWLYNRSHLIAYTFWDGEIDIAENLVTGTEQMNQQYMVEYEDLVRQTLRNGQKVMYRVTPNYLERELLPRSLSLEMLSEDGTLNQTVTIFNIQDHVHIDYATGASTSAFD